MTKGTLFLGLALVLPPSAASAARQGSILLYPTALRTGANILAKCTWREPLQKYAPHAVATRGRGGPRDANAVAMTLENAYPEYAYWQTIAGGVRPGRTYLLGVWAKVEKAKMLLWWNGIEADTGKKTDMRVYFNSGCSPILDGYFDEDTRRRLSGDPDEWRLVARTFALPAAMLGDAVDVECGFARAPGRATFAEPFLIDVTEQPRTMEVELKGSKPVKRLLVVRTDTRDPEWRREFDVPVTDFAETLSSVSPAFFGMGADPMAGHALIVTYDDMTECRVSCPVDGLFIRE